MATHRFNKAFDNCDVSATLVTLSDEPLAQSACPRRLVLLHGAGLAGDLTWRLVVNYLTEWDEILIPDLPGMGSSAWLNGVNPDFEMYLTAVTEFLARLRWAEFDLVGYSFGGLLAMHVSETHDVGRLGLIEPAALLATDAATLLKRAGHYHNQAGLLMSGQEGAVLEFLDTVSPARDKSGDSLVVRRLSENLRGLGYGVSAVAEALARYAEYYASWTASVPGMSLIGGLSPVSMRERHLQLESESRSWALHEVPRADHGVVYARPKQVAAAINAMRS